MKKKTDSLENWKKNWLTFIQADDEEEKKHKLKISKI